MNSKQSGRSGSGSTQTPPGGSAWSRAANSDRSGSSRASWGRPASARLIAIAGALVLLAGCTSTSPATSPAPAADGSVGQPSATVLPEPYELPGDRDLAQWGEPLATLTGKALDTDGDSRYASTSDGQTLLSREGWQVDLMGAYQLGAGRVLVEFRLNAAKALRTDMMVWSDPDYDAWFHAHDPEKDGFDGHVWEFSDVHLTVAGDETSYRPVRTGSNYCLCSMSLDYFKTFGDTSLDDIPVYVVMSAPENAATVSLSIRDVGTFSEVAVTEMPTRSVVPLGNGYQLRLLEVTRPSPGVVRVRFSIEAPAGQSGRSSYGVCVTDEVGTAAWKRSADQKCQYHYLVAVDPASEHGGWARTDPGESCSSCTVLVASGESGLAVDGELDMPDPGSQTVLVAPTSGWPLSPVAVEGDASAADQLTRYHAQSQTEGAKISNAGIELDAAVLFDVDSATLTSDAESVLDQVAKQLERQEPQPLQIIGHTDSTGAAEHNLELSKQRATAVRKALADRLGSGWSFTTSGEGESSPKIKESGLSGSELTRARAANRRVEVKLE